MVHYELSQTPSKIELLAKSQVRSLDVRDTSVEIADLQHFSKSYGLNVIWLSDPDLKPDDVTYLEMIPRLESVLVNDEATTRKLLSGIVPPVSHSAQLTEVEKRAAATSASIQIAEPVRHVLD